MRRLASIIVLGLTGCVGTRPTDRPPPDFALSLNFVRTQQGITEPAWYVVQPGGEFRAATGERTPASGLPPFVRTLNDQQEARVWLAARDAGLLEGTPPGVACADDAIPAEPAAIVYAAGDGRRRTRRIDAVESLSPLAALLRELAWASEGGATLPR